MKRNGGDRRLRRSARARPSCRAVRRRPGSRQSRWRTPNSGRGPGLPDLVRALRAPEEQQRDVARPPPRRSHRRRRTKPHRIRRVKPSARGRSLTTGMRILRGSDQPAASLRMHRRGLRDIRRPGRRRCSTSGRRPAPIAPIATGVRFPNSRLAQPLRRDRLHPIGASPDHACPLRHPRARTRPELSQYGCPAECRARRTIDRIDESRDVERERHPRAAGPGAGMDRARAARRRLPAGDQGGARPGAGRAVRDGRLLVLLARHEGLLGRRPARAARRFSPERPGVRASGVRLREPHRDRRRRAA